MKLAFIVVALGATLAGCEQPSTAKSPADLPDIIGRQVAAGAREVSLSELTAFEWEGVHVFSPYEGEETICRALGRFDAECRTKADFHLNDDGIYLLVFVGSSRIVGSVKHGRNHGGFNVGTHAYFPRSAAVFVVTEDKAANDSRKKWYLLTPKRG